MLFYLDANALGQTELSMGERVTTALLGYATVFAGLLVLMAIVFIMGAIFKAIAKKHAAEVDAARAAAPSPIAPPKPIQKLAPGTAGEVKRFDVPDREAALIMAIVADQMGRPLNELRVKSIKEVKDNEV